MPPPDTGLLSIVYDILNVFLAALPVVGPETEGLAKVVGVVASLVGGANDITNSAGGGWVTVMITYADGRTLLIRSLSRWHRRRGGAGGSRRSSWVDLKMVTDPAWKNWVTQTVWVRRLTMTPNGEEVTACSCPALLQPLVTSALQRDPFRMVRSVRWTCR